MNNRTKRVNQLIKKELSQLILREIDFPERILVTITRVEVSVDLKEAKIYVSVMPREKTSEIIRILKRKVFELQKGLDKRLRMKIVPRINFREEEKTAEAGRIEELLEEIRKEE